MRERLSSRTRRILAGLGIVLIFVLIVARECDLIGLSLCRNWSREEHTSWMQDTRTISTRSLDVEIRDGDRKLLAPFNRASAEERIHVSAQVTRFDLRGLYWLPLWKTGRCTYEVTFTSDHPSVTGSMEGTIERRVLGISSAHDFREALHEAVLLQALAAIPR